MSSIVDLTNPNMLGKIESNLIKSKKATYMYVFDIFYINCLQSIIIINNY